jgi:hypothetical protein
LPGVVLEAIFSLDEPAHESWQLLSDKEGLWDDQNFLFTWVCWVPVDVENHLNHQVRKQHDLIERERVEVASVADSNCLESRSLRTRWPDDDGIGTVSDLKMVIGQASTDVLIIGEDSQDLLRRLLERCYCLHGLCDTFNFIQLYRSP